MKKLLLLIGLVIFYSFQSLGYPYYSEKYALWSSDRIKELDSIGFFNGDPNQTTILEKTNDYIVIRNPSISSAIAYENQKIYPEIFLLETESYCKKLKKYKYVIYFSRLDKHTVYALCGISIQNTLDPNYSDLRESSTKYESNLFWSGLCLISDTWEDDYKEFKCDEVIKWLLKKWPKAKILHKELKERERKFKDRNFILELKKRVFANKGNEQFGGDDPTIIPASSGTGFFITNNGHIITNNHVIDSCNKVKVHYKGNERLTKLVASDLLNDLALLKSEIIPDDIFAISKEDIGLLGEIYVAGFPFGKEISSSIKVTKGVVSSLSGIGDNYSNMQVDAALQPGNSGGPIIDENGNVVGVAVAKLDFAKALEIYDAIPENTNFGIKSSVVKTFVKANNVGLTTPSNRKLTKNEIGQKITKATVYLDCWMTQAKINELRSRKVMFENLQ